MYKDKLSKKLIDIMGNVALNITQKSWCLLTTLDSADPNLQIQGMRTIFECIGLSPRHETKVDSCEISKDEVQEIIKKNHDKINHNLKGWFEINKNQPLDQTISEICYFFQNYLDFTEKTVVFSEFLSSKYLPLPVNFFSMHVDDEKKDNYLLREHASEFIQMRQLLNLNVGPTSRGSLILDFLKPLADEPEKQSVILGAFIEELLRRLKNKPKTTLSPQVNMPMNMNFDGNSDPMQNMMKKMRSILPPEILDQLKNLFSDLDNDDDKGIKF